MSAVTDPVGDVRWGRRLTVVVGVLYVGVAVYVFATAGRRMHGDDAVIVILADKSLRSHALIASDWYYANGDVWVFGPHLFALLPVAILGVGFASLLASLVLAFLTQLGAAWWAYVRLCGGRWSAALATMMTLMAWSVWHVDFNYVQVAYGFVTILYLLVFTACATLGEAEKPPWWRWLLLGAAVAAIAIQNPMRAFTYGVAPTLVGVAWPWRGLPVRRRLAIGASVVGGWVVAWASYRWLVLPAVELSVPSGHVSFVLRGWGGIKANLAMLERGILVLCGGGSSGVRAIPGLLLALGALGLTIHEVVSSRAFTALRCACVMVLAQFGGVLMLVIVGNLLTEAESTRYVMPGWLGLLGLGAILAGRALTSTGRGVRRIAQAWLVLLPITAVGALPDVRPPAPVTFLRPDSSELQDLAAELEHRGLTAGFSINVTANLLTMFSHGTAVTCPVTFRNAVIPERWLADTSCFRASRLPRRFFIVIDRIELEEASLRQTLPAPLERIRVGDTYEAYVYRTADVSLAWLDLPVPDGPNAVFPMRFSASNLQLVREKVVFQTDELVGTGEPGTVVYGPYIELLKGEYEAVWYGRGVGGPGRISFTAMASFGRNRLAPATEFPTEALRPTRGELIRIPFSLSRSRQQIEFPVTSIDGGRIVLDELVVERKR